MAEDIFRRVIGALDQAEIPYMLTGSFASSYHGSPRATQDIDVVISATPQQLRRLVALFPREDYYVDEGAALEAHRTQGQFNVIDLATGWKVDLIIQKSRPFSREEFNRRSIGDLGGVRLAIATAEDVVIAKLEWAKLGGSQRQIEDAASILRIRSGDLDRQYLAKWIRQLDLDEQWQQACRVAGIPC
ncbi:MAG TPA: hypothetical protein VFQ76_03025 [Longimicrobiaceae bacterium]|nr:hypothetical protein [Longimicrobiaceae bacterium]